MNKIYTIFLLIALLSCGSNEEHHVPDELDNTKAKKVLFVLTSHDSLGETGEKTGFWLEEFAAPYYFLKDKGVQITIASPLGGQPPIDPRSELPDNQSPATIRFNSDTETQNLLAHSQKLSDLSSEDFDAVFYPGGHGPLWDLAEDKNSIALIESFIQEGKPVAAVCHAPGVLRHVKNEDGTALVQDRKVTGFSDSEEKAVKLDHVVPFLVEDMLREEGGIYSKAENWQAHTEEDGLLITGQNPASSEATAELLFQKLNKSY